MNSKSEASQQGGQRGSLSPNFYLISSDFRKFQYFDGKLLGFAIGKDRGFEFYGKIFELAQSTL